MGGSGKKNEKEEKKGVNLCLYLKVNNSSFIKERELEPTFTPSLIR